MTLGFPDECPAWRRVNDVGRFAWDLLCGSDGGVLI